MKKILLMLLGLSLSCSAEFILVKEIDDPESVVNDGVVRDTATNLEWQLFHPSFTHTSGNDWEDAITHCEQLQLDGGGWRLPNLQEMYTLIKFDGTYEYGDPLIAPVFKHYTMTGSPYWTSTSSQDFTDKAYLVIFGDAGTHLRVKTGRIGYGENGAYVKCVRNGGI